jgi:hypothetical protein
MDVRVEPHESVQPIEARWRPPQQGRLSRAGPIIHVDGSASGAFATTKALRTTKRLAACMEAGGTLRVQVVLLTAKRAACRLVRRASNRSRKSLVSFAPLGHRLSGGLFFARTRLGAIPFSSVYVDESASVTIPLLRWEDPRAFTPVSGVALIGPAFTPGSMKPQHSLSLSCAVSARFTGLLRHTEPGEPG